MPHEGDGKKLLRWIGEAAHDMALIDSFRPARRRGTFMNLNRTQKYWNELDVAIVSEKVASMINFVRTINTGLGDHRAKIFGLDLAKRYKKS